MGDPKTIKLSDLAVMAALVLAWLPGSPVVGWVACKYMPTWLGVLVAALWFSAFWAIIGGLAAYADEESQQ